MREVLISIGLVALAVAMLGTDWHGIEVRPGVWRDAVTPAQWATFGIAVVAGGALTARLVVAWRRRLLVLVPLAGWLLWQLRDGTLWPLAFAIYATGIAACWVAGLTLGGWIGRRGRTA